jgi:hypothetical protein
MPKSYVQQSLERDAYLSRKEDKKTSLQHLKTSVERLSKAMSLSSADKAELLVYAEQLLEHHEGNNSRSYENGSQGSSFKDGAMQEKMPSVVTDGAQASD